MPTRALAELLQTAFIRIARTAGFVHSADLSVARADVGVCLARNTGVLTTEGLCLSVRYRPRLIFTVDIIASGISMDELGIRGWPGNAMVHNLFNVQVDKLNRAPGALLPAVVHVTEANLAEVLARLEDEVLSLPPELWSRLRDAWDRHMARR
jgi:hypothetical protein